MNDLETVDEEEMLKIAIAMSLQEEELVFNKGNAPKEGRPIVTTTKVDLKSIQAKAVHNILADMVQVLQQLLARCHPAPSVVCLGVE